MVVALIGVLFVGGLLAQLWPRSVAVAYALDPGVTEVDVDYVQDGESVASVRFKHRDAETTVLRHTVRLPPGQYEARITIYRTDGHGVEYARVLLVPTEGLTRFDLQEATTRSE